MTPDGELLRRYAEAGSEAAFAELVQRHVDLVYSAALRQVNGDAHLAHDVSQAVFTDLARKAATLSRHRALTGWLYTGAHFAAAKAVRSESRRRTHEQEAQAMQELLQTPAPDFEWEKLRPVLDQVMHELKASDRDVILMRYFENRQLADIGQRLGLSEDAARKRVDRALDKLRTFLTKRGVTATAALAGVLSANAVQIAPTGLAATLASSAVAGAAGVGTTMTVLKLMSITKLKLAVGVVLAAGVVTPMVVQHKNQVGLVDKISSLQAQIDELTKLKAENERLAGMVADAQNARLLADNQKAELLRLRNEVGMLREQTNQMNGLREQNRQLLAQQADGAKTKSDSAKNTDEQPPVPKTSWAFSGYATPEATLQSLFWALREGDTNAFQAYLQGLGPEARAKIEQDAKSRGGANAFASLGNDETGGMTGFQLVKKVPLSDDKVVVEIQTMGDTAPAQMILMRKIGDEWKLSDVIKN
jgi:RNA polymerase sigma factor (sigma-70 family)